MLSSLFCIGLNTAKYEIIIKNMQTECNTRAIQIIIKFAKLIC